MARDPKLQFILIDLLATKCDYFYKNCNFITSLQLRAKLITPFICSKPSKIAMSYRFFKLQAVFIFWLIEIKGDWFILSFPVPLFAGLPKRMAMRCFF